MHRLLGLPLDEAIRRLNGVQHHITVAFAPRVGLREGSARVVRIRVTQQGVHFVVSYFLPELANR